MTLNLSLMTREQRQHLQALGDLWASYGPLLRQRERVTGGMQWKPVAGAEYLTRYHPDPETGKKVARSLGRRSPETEAAYAEFMRLREEVKGGLESFGPKVDMAGRIAKALRLARVPARQAEGIRRLWAEGLLDRTGPLALLGANAVIAYEMAAGILAPPRVVREDEPFVYVRAGVTLDEDFAFKVGGSYMPRHCDVGLDFIAPGHVRLQADDGTTLHLISRLGAKEHSDRADLPDSVREALQEVLELEPVDAVAVGRDAGMVVLTAVDPRTYCLLTPVISGDPGRAREIAWARVDAVTEILDAHWPLGRLSEEVEGTLTRLRHLLPPDGAGPYSAVC